MAVGAYGSEEVCGNGQLLGELVRLGAHGATGACTEADTAMNMTGVVITGKGLQPYCILSEIKASCVIRSHMSCIKTNTYCKLPDWNTAIKGVLQTCIQEPKTGNGRLLN